MNYLIKYGKRKLFKRGIGISLTLSYKCNLRCSYCSLKNFGDTIPESNDVHSVYEWIEFIKTFPVKIREVYITGGEPSLFKGVETLCNWLIDNGYFVTVFSNLTDKCEVFLKVKISARFKIQSTYHESANINHFTNNYLVLSRLHRIDIDEINTNHFPYLSNKKQLTTIENEKKPSILRVNPDFSIYTNCYDHNQHYLKNIRKV